MRCSRAVSASNAPRRKFPRFHWLSCFRHRNTCSRWNRRRHALRHAWPVGSFRLSNPCNLQICKSYDITSGSFKAIQCHLSVHINKNTLWAFWLLLLQNLEIYYFKVNINLLCSYRSDLKCMIGPFLIQMAPLMNDSFITQYTVYNAFSKITMEHYITITWTNHEQLSSFVIFLWQH